MDWQRAGRVPRGATSVPGGTLVFVDDSADVMQALRAIAICLLPYPDPLTRRRVRRSARTLVAAGPWAEEKANSNEVAQLALLRLLWLQGEARRAARAGMFEALALLSRSAIDTCIVGCYCLAVSDAAERINQLNAQHLKSMTEYLPASFLNRRVRDEMLQLVDEATRDPNIFAMARAVDDASGDKTVTMLYRAYYAPLSTLYAHGGGMALLRHVDNDEIADRPAKYWSRRSALHLLDSCVGLLAGRLANAQGNAAAADVFDRYHDAHRDRTVTPLATIAFGTFRRAFEWRKVAGSVRAGRELRAYLLSGQALVDDADTREGTVRELARRCLEAVPALNDPRALEVALNGFVRQSLDALTTPQEV